MYSFHHKQADLQLIFFGEDFLRKEMGFATTSGLPCPCSVSLGTRVHFSWVFDTPHFCSFTKKQSQQETWKPTMPLSFLCPMAGDPALKPSSSFLVWTSPAPSYSTSNTAELCLHSRYDLPICPQHCPFLPDPSSHLKPRWRKGKIYKRNLQ